MQVFIDDFIVYGHKKEHLNHLKKCMIQCKNNGISVNPEKYASCVNLGVLLGHIVCEDGLLVDPRKINIITNMPTPMSVTKLKKFLGVASFYWWYLRTFVIKATPNV